MRLSKKIWTDPSLYVWSAGVTLGLLSIWIPHDTYNSTLSWFMIPYCIWGCCYAYNWGRYMGRNGSWLYATAVGGFMLPFAMILPILLKYKTYSGPNSEGDLRIIKTTYNMGSNTNFSTPKEFRAHRINRVIFLFVLIVLGVHILCSLNITYDGYSLTQFGGKKYVTRETAIKYFGIIPLWVSNLFYTLYVVYGILLVYGITGIIGRAKKQPTK